jgi:UMF1 family MFS transporter
MFLFFGVKEPKKSKDGLSAAEYIGKSIKSVLKTLKEIRRHRTFFYFLISMFCFANAINAVILFLFLFARQEISLTVQMFFIVYVIQSFGAVVGSFVSGKLTDKFGAKRVLVWSGFGWIGVILMLYFVKNVEMFIVAGTLGGAFLGMWTTAQRPKLVEMVSKNTVGQFFGYLELTNKFSGVIGPIVFGALASFVSYGWAMLSLIVFFAVGLVTLRFVPGDGK